MIFVCACAASLSIHKMMYGRFSRHSMGQSFHGAIIPWGHHGHRDFTNGTRGVSPIYPPSPAETAGSCRLLRCRGGRVVAALERGPGDPELLHLVEQRSTLQAKSHGGTFRPA